MTHTPTPWHIGMKPGPMIYGPKGEQVADMSTEMVMSDEHRANAAYIVRAVNAHDGLVAALKEARKWMMTEHAVDGNRCDKAIKQVDAALAKAAGN